MNTTETAQTLEGQCLCGAVGVTAKALKHVEVCHCGMCRTWGGGPLLAVNCGSELQLSGREHVGVFASSEWAERGFCKVCGTHLYYRFKQADLHMLPVGLFGDTNGFEVKEQIFIDKKPSYYAFANQTAVLTEAQVFEKYAPK